MLLTIDTGNSQTTVGLFVGTSLKKVWKIPSNPTSLKSLCKKIPRGISDVIISSVVPSLRGALKHLAQNVTSQRPIFVHPTMKLPIKIKIRFQKSVGVDRLVNAVEAHGRWKTDTLIVDLGTAATFDVVTASGDFLGGAITAGPELMSEILVQRCALLPYVPLKRPQRVIGRSTTEAIQAGLFCGYVGLIDGLIDRIQGEFGSPLKVIATGGWATSLAPYSKKIKTVEPFLTLEGLWRLHGYLRGDIGLSI